MYAGCLLQGGVCSRGCLLWGVSAPRVVSAPEGCLLWGVSAPGVLLLGVSAPGGGLLLGGVSQHALRQTPPLPLTESQMPVKTLPWPNFVAAGNKGNIVVDGVLATSYASVSLPSNY